MRRTWRTRAGQDGLRNRPSRTAADGGGPRDGLWQTAPDLVRTWRTPDGRSRAAQDETKVARKYHQLGNNRQRAAFTAAAHWQTSWWGYS